MSEWAGNRGLYSQMGDGWVSFTISWSLLKFISMKMEFMSTVSVMLSNHLILYHLLLLLPSISPSIGSFSMNRLFSSGGQSIGAPASVSVLPMNIQDWFPSGLTGLISLQSEGLSSSPAPQFESINSLALSLLYGPTCTSIHDYWENHSSDYTDFCWQSDVSVF